MDEHLDELNPLIEGINEGVHRAANIVKSLNHYSRKNDSKIADCNIHAIIDNCLVILQNQIKNRIEIEKIYTDGKYVITGNEGKLHQVILNILTNAIHAIEKQGVITIKIGSKKSNIIISIKDSGSGISKENLSKIFDPFFTTKEAGKGTGLGLSIAYNIVKDHNGTLEVNSEVNKGTEFKIILPL